MSRRKKYKYDIIHDFYKKRQMSEEVKKTAVDINRLNTQRMRSDIDNYVDSIYSMFNIKRFKNKDEFLDYQANSNPDLKTSEVNKRWEEYKHRDDLITSGQYEDLRYKQYRENYITALKKGNFPMELITNVENLSIEKWKEIIILPSANKEKPNDRQFPVLGGYRYGDANEAFYRATIAEIKEAFNALGVPYIDDTDLLKKRDNIVKAKSLKVEDNELTTYALDNLSKVLPKYQAGIVKDMPYKKDNLVDDVLYIGQRLIPDKYVRYAKDGHRYILFVGSEKKGTPNEKITKVLLEGYDIR